MQLAVLFFGKSVLEPATPDRKLFVLNLHSIVSYRCWKQRIAVDVILLTISAFSAEKRKTRLGSFFIPLLTIPISTINKHILGYRDDLFHRKAHIFPTPGDNSVFSVQRYAGLLLLPQCHMPG